MNRDAVYFKCPDGDTHVPNVPSGIWIFQNSQMSRVERAYDQFWDENGGKSGKSEFCSFAVPLKILPKSTADQNFGLDLLVVKGFPHDMSQNCNFF